MFFGQFTRTNILQLKDKRLINILRITSDRGIPNPQLIAEKIQYVFSHTANVCRDKSFYFNNSRQCHISIYFVNDLEELILEASLQRDHTDIQNRATSDTHFCKYL